MAVGRVRACKMPSRCQSARAVKIVDVNEFYAERGGGVRTYVHAKLQAARAAGHELVVVAPGPSDAQTSRFGGRIRWVKSPPMPIDPRYYVLHRKQAVQRVLLEEQPDIIEGSSPWTSGWFAASGAGQAKKVFVYHQDPVAVYPHTLLDRYFAPSRIDSWCAPYWSYLRHLAQRFDRTVVAGAWLASRLKAFGISNATAVPFGIDRSRFSHEHASPQLRMEWLDRCGLGEQGRLLVCISRHHPEKRLGTLVQAVLRVNRVRPVGLVIVGDGPLRSWLERQVRGIPQVQLAGYVEDRAVVAALLASADAMLHGSAAETFGFVLAEAMCSGLPIVAPNRGGAFDLVEPEFSETYEPGDVEACAQAVLRLLARQPGPLREASLAASERKVQTQEAHFEALFSCYAQLCSAEGGPARAVAPRFSGETGAAAPLRG